MIALSAPQTIRFAPPTVQFGTTCLQHCLHLWTSDRQSQKDLAIVCLIGPTGYGHEKAREALRACPSDRDAINTTARTHLMPELLDKSESVMILYFIAC